jgi:ubiquinone/menaquinone biosynthesis C-methylase UbiE
MSHITDSLQHFYDHQAQKFTGTRKKHWPEFDHILQAMKWHIQQDQTKKILELGCGDGRFARILKTSLSHADYTGIDISWWLLDIAREHQDSYGMYEQADMTQYVSQLDSNSQDIIIAIASIQHIFPLSKRKKLVNNMYRALKPWWMLITIDRAYSDRAKKKFRRPLRKHIRHHIATGWQRQRNDRLIPWKNNNHVITHQRYYHFFTLAEKQLLCSEIGRKIQHNSYIDKQWTMTQDNTHARNSFFVAVKSDSSPKVA